MNAAKNINYSKYSEQPQVSYETPTEFDDLTKPIEDIEPIDEEVIDVEEIDIEQDEPKDEIKMGRVNCDRLYIRKGPGKDYEPLTDIKKNDEVMIISNSDNSDWFEICSASGKEGFVMKEFIDVE